MRTEQMRTEHISLVSGIGSRPAWSQALVLGLQYSSKQLNFQGFLMHFAHSFGHCTGTVGHEWTSLRWLQPSFFHRFEW